jgi:AcrR family transcriptional regulator
MNVWVEKVRHMSHYEYIMSQNLLDSGRVNQKQRTRRALIDAADAFLRRGIIPTIDELTTAAMVSRATFYRYYSGVDALILELTPTERSISAKDVLLDAGGAPADERATRVHDALFDMIARNEARFRFRYRMSLERTPGDGPIARDAGRTALIEEALGPLAPGLDDEEYDRLVYALTAMTGIESFIALRDVCGLEPEEAAKIMRWAVRTIVRSVMGRGRRGAHVQEKDSDPTGGPR